MTAAYDPHHDWTLEDDTATHAPWPWSGAGLKPCSVPGAAAECPICGPGVAYMAMVAEAS